MNRKRGVLEEEVNLGFGNQVPPLLFHVKIICNQMELSEDVALEFYKHFQESGWRTKTGVPIKNWKQVLDQWIWDRGIANQ